MSDSIFERQQRREFESRGRFYDWALVKQSILEAKGARECADVESEQAAFVRFTDCTFNGTPLVCDADPSFDPIHDLLRREAEAIIGQPRGSDRIAAVEADARRAILGPAKTLVDLLFEEKHER